MLINNVTVFDKQNKIFRILNSDRITLCPWKIDFRINSIRHLTFEEVSRKLFISFISLPTNEVNWNLRQRNKARLIIGNIWIKSQIWRKTYFLNVITFLQIFVFRQVPLTLVLNFYNDFTRRFEIATKAIVGNGG